jgi:hypothetical protein
MKRLSNHWLRILGVAVFCVLVVGAIILRLYPVQGGGHLLFVPNGKSDLETVFVLPDCVLPTSAARWNLHCTTDLQCITLDEDTKPGSQFNVRTASFSGSHPLLPTSRNHLVVSVETTTTNIWCVLLNRSVYWDLRIGRMQRRFMLREEEWISPCIENGKALSLTNEIAHCATITK